MSGPLDGRWIGFDLDLTLVDSRPGIEAVYRQLIARTGVPIDIANLRIGPPLEDELRKWFPEEQVSATADLYRELYPEYAIELSLALSGAHEAIAAVHECGGRVMVISSKYAPNVSMHIEHLGFDVDEVVGWAFGDGKRDALLARSAVAYVGDFEADMQAAVAAGSAAIGVPTGPCTTAELFAAGADVVLADLHQFGPWLTSWLAESRLGVRPSTR